MTSHTSCYDNLAQGTLYAFKSAALHLLCGHPYRQAHDFKLQHKYRAAECIQCINTKSKAKQVKAGWHALACKVSKRHDCHFCPDFASSRQQQKVMAVLSASKASIVSHSRLCICSQQSNKKVGHITINKVSDLTVASPTNLTSTSYLCRLLLSVCHLYSTSLPVTGILVGPLQIAESQGTAVEKALRPCSVQQWLDKQQLQRLLPVAAYTESWLRVKKPQRYMLCTSVHRTIIAGPPVRQPVHTAMPDHERTDNCRPGQPAYAMAFELLANVGIWNSCNVGRQ